MTHLLLNKLMDVTWTVWNFKIAGCGVYRHIEGPWKTFGQLQSVEQLSVLPEEAGEFAPATSVYHSIHTERVHK